MALWRTATRIGFTPDIRRAPRQTIRRHFVSHATSHPLPPHTIRSNHFVLAHTGPGSSGLAVARLVVGRGYWARAHRRQTTRRPVLKTSRTAN